MPSPPPGNAGGNPNNPQKVSIVGKVPIEYDPKSLNDVSNAIREQTSAQQNAGNASGGICERGVQQQQRANSIAIVAACLSGLAFVATVVVIVLNFAAISAANKSTAIADSALTDNQRQFELSNRPFVDLDNIRLDSLKEGQKPRIIFTLTNKGRFPASITTFNAFIGMTNEKASADEIIKVAESSSSNHNDSVEGIIPFSPSFVQPSVQSDSAMRKDQMIAINSLAAYISLTVEIKYINLVTKKPYYFIQVYKITTVPNFRTLAIKYHDDPQ
jgi:hypothetical protein